MKVLYYENLILGIFELYIEHVFKDDWETAKMMDEITERKGVFKTLTDEEVQIKMDELAISKNKPTLQQFALESATTKGNVIHTDSDNNRFLVATDDGHFEWCDIDNCYWKVPY